MALTDLVVNARQWARSQRDAYGHGEDRPLGAYLGVMATYAVVVTAAGNAVRISRRSLPPSWSFGDVVLLSIATHKVARLISKDPVTSPLRAPMTRFEGRSGEAELSEEVRGTGLRHALGELVTCPFCLDQWVCTALIFGLISAPKLARTVMTAFAAVAAADVMHHLYAQLQD